MATRKLQQAVSKDTNSQDAFEAPAKDNSASRPEKDMSLVDKAKALEAKAKARPRKRPARKLPVKAFENTQLNLFQNFLNNTNEERAALGNAIDLWDSIPKYSSTKLSMNKDRTEQGTLKLLKREFNYRGKKFRAIIQPARIEITVDGKLVEMDYYPSANEELVEDALRKLSTDQHQGYFDRDDYRSGTVFTLYGLREELKRRNHTRSYQEITLSLKILAKSNIEIVDLENAATGEGFAVSNYLPSMVGVTRKEWLSEPTMKWVVQFHPLVTQSIDQLTYRQFNYHQMMSRSTQLARWIHKQLALKFTFATYGRTFDMNFSTIKRDSALLAGYSEDSNRQAVAAVDAAFDELMPHVLMDYVKKVERGSRNKILDVVYSLTPSREFIKEMKAANKRLNVAEERLSLAFKAPPPGTDH